METLKQHIATGHPNRPGTKLEEILALVFHYTQNDRIWATDTMNAKYFGRAWHVGTTPALLGKPAEWVSKMLPGADGTPVPTQVEIPFNYGSAQIIADEDSVTEAMPIDEVAWSTGDRRLPWTEEFRGQQPAAKYIFKFRQNYKSIGIEICNNRSWAKACANAARWAIDFLKEKGLKVDVEKSLDPNNPNSVPAKGYVVLLRHFDLSGKICPKPMVDDPKAWEVFIRQIAAEVNMEATA